MPQPIVSRRPARPTSGNMTPRQRTTSKKPARRSFDTLYTLLLCQIALCGVLLLGGYLFRLMGGATYEQCRGKYMSLISDRYATSLDNEQMASINESIDQLRDQFTGLFQGGAEQPQQGEEDTKHYGEPSQVSLPNQPEEQQDFNSVLKPQIRLKLDEQLAGLTQNIGLSSFLPQPVISPYFMTASAMLAQPMAKKNEPMTAPDGNSLAPYYFSGSIQPPVYGMVTCMYGFRIHPISGELEFHTGMDIAAAHWTSILAPLPGTVKKVGESSIFGNYIVLEHAGGIETFYGHCDSIIAKEGDVVRQGDRIARVGTTGISTGYHLHFEVSKNNVRLDPIYLLQSWVGAT